MTTDIVERLRARSLNPQDVGRGISYAICDEAADEIERLRKLQVGLTCAEDEIERLRGVIDDYREKELANASKLSRGEV
jgi:hypothetical protein